MTSKYHVLPSFLSLKSRELRKSNIFMPRLICDSILKTVFAMTKLAVHKLWSGLNCSDLVMLDWQTVNPRP